MSPSEHTDEIINDVAQNSKNQFFNKILDQAIIPSTDRFDLIQEHNNHFNFIYNLNAEMSDKQLRKKCMDLDILLADGDRKDISGSDLMMN